MRMENTNHTVAFGFEGSFKLTHPSLNGQFRTIRSSCPKLTAALDSRIGEVDDEAVEDLRIPQLVHHKELRLRESINRQAVVRCTEPMINIIAAHYLPDDDDFYRQLRKAYKDAYDIPSIDGMATVDLRWFRGFAFTVKSVHRRLPFDSGD